MEKKFGYDPHVLSLVRITFWVYLVCIPVIAVLNFLPSILYRQMQINMFMIIYILIIAYLIYQTFRVARVLKAIKRSYCVISDHIVKGISTPDPLHTGTPFEIEKESILGVGKTRISIGSIRTFDAVLINTASAQYTIFAAERIKDLCTELQSDIREG